MRAADGEHEVEVAIVGSGFSGIAMAARLKRSGRDDFVILERGHDVGGTWRENTYPGCRCDVPSHVYSFSFAPNPEWSETFSPQPEIYEYLRAVADRERIREHVRFGCELEHASWDAEQRRWRLRTSSGTISARVLIAGAGPLHEPKLPDVPGLRGFRGHAVPLGDLGSRPRARGRAGRRDRHRRQRDPVRAPGSSPRSSGCTCSSARRRG